jgi:gentisate 1,2-dioxygenase
MTSELNTTSRTDFYERLGPLHYTPLWRIRGALTSAPTTAMEPFLWRYSEVKSLMSEAGTLITAQEANRRVLAFTNPGTAPGDVARATDTLWAAIQLVLPGEIAPAHRHSPAALRLVIEGCGGYTTVDDERYEMAPGDLILTPNWAWHAHGHDGDTPMLWLDGLDLPLVHALHSVFAEFPAHDVALHARQNGPSYGPDLFPYRNMAAALELQRNEPGDPFDDIIIEYRDPHTGGPVMPTISASMQLLRPGVATRCHRHTHSVVYHVVSGTGTSYVGDRRFDWGPGDTFAVPTWAPHRHANPTAADAVLFSFSDRPVIAALGLDRSAEEDDH